VHNLGRFTFPPGTWSYDSFPWVHEGFATLRTLIICATIVWVAYLLRKPLSELIGRLTELDTMFGKYKAAPPPPPPAPPPPPPPPPPGEPVGGFRGGAAEEIQEG
jgi:hypothetical protein